MLAVDYSRGKRLCSTVCRKNQSNEEYLERSEMRGPRSRRVFANLIKLELGASQSAMVHWSGKTHKLRIKNLEQGIMIKSGLIPRLWGIKNP